MKKIDALNVYTFNIYFGDHYSNLRRMEHYWWEVGVQVSGLNTATAADTAIVGLWQPFQVGSISPNF